MNKKRWAGISIALVLLLLALVLLQLAFANTSIQANAQTVTSDKLGSSPPVPKFKLVEIVLVGEINLTVDEILAVYDQARYPGQGLPTEIVIEEVGPAGSVTTALYLNDSGITKWELTKVTLHSSVAENHDAALAMLTKELVGTTRALAWLMNNPGYLPTYEDDTWVVFVDGMGLLASADLQNTTFGTAYTMWDGIQLPTCAQLTEVQQLSQVGHIRGEGIQPLLDLYCSD